MIFLLKESRKHVRRDAVDSVVCRFVECYMHTSGLDVAFRSVANFLQIKFERIYL